MGLVEVKDNRLQLTAEASFSLRPGAPRPAPRRRMRR